MLIPPPPFSLPTAKQATKLEYVDALRGIAILGVIAVHSLLSVGTTKTLPNTFVTVVSNGAWGVRLFFIASAFTLFLSLHNKRKQEKNSTLNFYLRRWFRIAPAYYVGIIVYSLWTYFITRTWYPASKVLMEALFLHGSSPAGMNSIVPGGWSITVEMCFYLLVPVLATYITSLTRAVWALLGAILVHAACGWVLRQYPFTPDPAVWNLYLAWFLPKQLPVFALGFVFYFLSRLRVTVSASAILAASLLLIGVFAAKPSLAVAPPDFALLPEDLGMSFGLMLLSLALSQRPFRFFVNGFTRKTGELSFGLYLVHFGVLYVLKWRGLADFIIPDTTTKALLNYGVRFIFVLVASYILAYILHHTIEIPGQKLGKKLISRLGS